MKWLRHMTATWDDERIARLIGSGGMEGLAAYGLYWRVCEILAAQMEGKTPSCSVQYSVRRWSLLLSLRGSHVESALVRLGASGLVTVTREGDEIRVTNYKLLKYRDEYSRKSGQSTDNVPPTIEENTPTVQKETASSAESRSAEPEVPDLELAGKLPLAGGGEYRISKAQVAEWAQLFPGIDVTAECRRLKAWLIGNPKKQSTKRGILRRIMSWLSRAQDEQKPGAHNGNGNGHYPTKTDRTLQAARELLTELQGGSSDLSGNGSAGECIEGNAQDVRRGATGFRQ